MSEDNLLNEVDFDDIDTTEESEAPTITQAIPKSELESATVQAAPNLDSFDTAQDNPQVDGSESEDKPDDSITKIIPKKELENATVWQAPSFGNNATAKRNSPLVEPEPEPEPEPELEEILQLPTADEIEAIQKKAYEEGFELGKQEGVTTGKQEGLAAGAAEIQEKTTELQNTITNFTQALDALTTPFSELDNQVEDELVRLATYVAKEVVYREIQLSPELINQAVSTAISLLPAADRAITIHLHPEDALIAKEHLQQIEDSKHSWKIVEDAALSRGGCIVENDISQVDATVEKRLNDIISTALHE